MSFLSESLLFAAVVFDGALPGFTSWTLIHLEICDWESR
jgi:hypothetical protein